MTGWFNVDIDTSDINRTIGDIRKYDGRTVLRIEEAVDKSIKAISKKSKQNAPHGSTGKLRRNIRSMLMERNKYGPEGMSYVKGGRRGAPHAHLVEQGAKASTAQPKYKKAMTILDRKISTKVGKGFIGPAQRTGFSMFAKIPARKASPFMKPAYEDEKDNTVNRIKAAIEGKNIKK